MRNGTRSVVQRLFNGGGLLPLPLLPLLLLVLRLFYSCEASLPNAVTTTVPTTGDVNSATAVHKCCGPNEVLANDWCRAVNSTGHGPWTPEFTANYEDEAFAGLKRLPTSSISYKWVHFYAVIFILYVCVFVRYIFYTLHAKTKKTVMKSITVFSHISVVYRRT